MNRTLDQIEQAKAALLRALRTAEQEAPAPVAKKLERLAEACESLQANVRDRIAKKNR